MRSWPFVCLLLLAACSNTTVPGGGASPPRDEEPPTQDAPDDSGDQPDEPSETPDEPPPQSPLTPGIYNGVSECVVEMINGVTGFRESSESSNIETVIIDKDGLPLEPDGTPYESGEITEEEVFDGVFVQSEVTSVHIDEADGVVISSDIHMRVADGELVGFATSTFRPADGGTILVLNNFRAVSNDGSSLTLNCAFSVGDEPAPPALVVLYVSTVGDGTVLVDPVGEETEFGGLSYAPSTRVTLTAQPSDGAAFIGWSGDVEELSAQIELVLTTDTTLLAVFSEVEPPPPSPQPAILYVSYVGDGAIFVDPIGDPTELGGLAYALGTHVTLTAIASEGSVFIGWSGDIETTDPETELVVSSDMFIVAAFVLVLPPPPPPILDALLVAADGTFLGIINNDPFDPDSLANPFGTYGNRFASESIWNQFGTYGSDFGTYSPWNDFAFNPPEIYLGNTFVSYLTTNEFKLPAVHPNDLAIAIGRYDVIR